MTGGDSDRRPTRAYAVTAYAAVNALGTSTRQVIAALGAGRSGVRACPLEVPFTAPTGAVADPLPALPARLAAHDSRTARLAVAGLAEILPAIARAVAGRGAGRVALVVGTTTAGLGRTEQAYGVFRRTGALPVDYDVHRQHSFGSLIEAVRVTAGIGGPAYVVSTACSASAKAIASAQRLLDNDVADAVIVGGVDGLCQITLRGFHSLDILSDEACRPFSTARKGINLGEGAAYLLLERDGDAATALLGSGESSDAYHMTAPHPEGQGARAAMAGALAQAGLHPTEIDHINAHSPGTRQNDLSEGKAITSLFGGEVPVASTKGYTGHLLGAGGVTEAIFAMVAVEQGWIPASMGADPVDAALGLNVPTRRMERCCRAVLSNSFAFGGNNVSVIFGRAA
ncbi:MAG TPA: beta-ketoacyl-ACP synthase [Polyangia bacterium]|jgi:3-oxoacyl-[acyl-carrier-protein] synthase-1|nr:beta-ketoacyl-ACP synthase [Polyangia bacterium]